MPMVITPRFRNTVCLLLILLIGAGFRFYRIGEKSLWVDEFDSLRIAAGHFEPNSHKVNYSPLGVLPALRGDVDVPFYYMLLNIWVRLAGNSEGALRALSALFGIGALGLIYLVGRRLLNDTVGLLGTLMLAVSPLHVIYGQEARGYALQILLTLLSTYFFVRIAFCNEKGRTLWAGYWLSAGLAIYTHYFSIFIILAQNLFLLLARRDLFVTTRWLAGQVCLALAWCVPFLLLFQIDSYDWVQVKSSYDAYWPYAAIPYMFAKFTFADFNEELWRAAPPVFALGVILLAFLFLLALRSLHGARHGRTLLLLLLWLLVPVLILLLIDLRQNTKAAMTARYLMASSPPYYLLFAAGVAVLKGRYLKIAAVAVLTSLMVFALGFYYSRPKLEQWREAAEYINREPVSLDLTIFYPSYFEFLRYYTSRLEPAQAISPETLVELSEIPTNLRSVLILIESSSPRIRPEALDQMMSIMQVHYRLVGSAQWQGVRILKYCRREPVLQ